MFWWILIPAALVGFVIVSRGSVYRAFFSLEHLQELSTLCQELHHEALAAIQTPQGLPPNRVTKAGLAIAYTLTPQGEKHRAYLSLSYKGGWFASSAAGILVACIRRFLSLPLPFELLGVSTRGVYHIAFLVDAIPNVAPVSAEAIYEEALTEGREISNLLARPLPENAPQ
jgi:hypothetical protein